MSCLLFFVASDSCPGPGYGPKYTCLKPLPERLDLFRKWALSQFETAACIIPLRPDQVHLLPGSVPDTFLFYQRIADF
jgi:hypothetical protein